MGKPSSKAAETNAHQCVAGGLKKSLMLDVQQGKLGGRGNLACRQPSFEACRVGPALAGCSGAKSRCESSCAREVDPLRRVVARVESRRLSRNNVIYAY